MSKDVVNSKKAKELVENGALLLDVRSQAEFDKGAIEGAKLIPVSELKGNLDKVLTWLEGDKDRPIVVYCASGMRSAAAKTLLDSHGFSRVVDLGGISNWSK